MKTSTIPVSAPAWHIVDAKGITIGRLAAMVAPLLRGKHKASFSPHQLGGDHVIVINAAEVSIPAFKLDQKEFYRHTGFIGSLKTMSLRTMMEKHPTRAVELAIKGMLPKNRLRAQMLKRLHLFAGSEHNHEAQLPTAYPAK